MEILKRDELSFWSRRGSTYHDLEFKPLDFLVLRQVQRLILLWIHWSMSVPELFPASPIIHDLNNHLWTVFFDDDGGKVPETLRDGFDAVRWSREGKR